LSGQPIPDWTEGILLPPYQQTGASADRSIYAVRSYYAERTDPLSQASIVLVKGQYKMHYYFGYAEVDGKELVKLFDVREDPGEMNDLSQSQKDIADEMLKELKAKLAEAEKPYL
jgi:arylsulfatase A-like enzyme